MVRGTLSLGKAVIGVSLAGVLMTAGCSTKPEGSGFSMAGHREALEKTGGITPMPAGSETERKALERFNDFYAVYSAEVISSKVRRVYAADAWFGDPFHAVEGIDAIERYFLVMSEPVQSCTFTVDSMQRTGSDYYARWTMKLVSKAAGNQPIEAIGLSHVRYNEDGLIVFQQDYWDTSVMLDRLPVVGFWTRMVKGRIAKGLEE